MPTPTLASCRPRSTSGSPTTRPESSGVPGRYRSCSTGRSSPHGRARAARSASAAARCTGARPCTTTWG
jgi:hypothetical protein